MDYLFVYGTLRAEFDNPKSKQLLENAELIGAGFFHGKLYNVSWYPGAVLSENTNHKVYGCVYRLKNTEKTLEWLDDYEGMGKNDAEPHEYVRQKIGVFLQNHEELNCWVYLYNHSMEKLEFIPSGDYLKFRPLV
jgi:gamma-glutamylcyclotransferase (GGCT)/AIG2-like uncharacterized protein YtfP